VGCTWGCLLDLSIDVMYESINVISGLVLGAICNSPTNNAAMLHCTSRGRMTKILQNNASVLVSTR
jgi:hypothetical protein